MRQQNRKSDRGMGPGAKYVPFVQVSDFGSLGTCSNPIDWKTGRTVHLLSQGEAMLWHLLRWDERTAEIYEQYPLPLKDTLRLCDQYGIRHPHNRNTPMTTDFLVLQRDGYKEAYSLKSSRTALENPRTVQKLFIEQCYWREAKVRFHLRFKVELNAALYNNIRQVVEYYSSSAVHDDSSVLKHLIATRKILPQHMDTAILNYSELAQQYRKEIDTWKTCKSTLE